MLLEHKTDVAYIRQQLKMEPSPSVEYTQLSKKIWKRLRKNYIYLGFMSYPLLSILYKVISTLIT